MSYISQKKIEQETSVPLLNEHKKGALSILEGYRFRMRIIIIAALVGGGLAYATYSVAVKGAIEVSKMAPFIVLGAIVGATIYFLITLSFRNTEQDNIKRLNYRLAQLGPGELVEVKKDDFFTRLVQINFKYIDQYYLQTQEQADKSFRLASFASISGFIILLIGIIMLFTKTVDAAKVTTAAGLISQFISAIFFYLYNRTILKMSQYHQKLVLTQNVSLALKTTEQMGAVSKAKSLELIIDRLTLDINKSLTDFKE